MVTRKNTIKIILTQNKCDSFNAKIKLTVAAVTKYHQIVQQSRDTIK